MLNEHDLEEYYELKTEAELRLDSKTGINEFVSLLSEKRECHQ